MTAAPGGYVVGVGHTDNLVFDGATLPAPHDPLGGAALIVRPVATTLR